MNLITGIYLTGCFVSATTCGILLYRDWARGRDLLFSEILAVLIVIVLSWFSLGIIAVESIRFPIIKGRKQK